MAMKRFVMAWAVVLAGCGGSSPKDKCEDIGDTTCERLVECVAEARGMRDACVASFESTGVCARAKSVTGNYDSCINGLHHNTCEQLFPTDENGDRGIALPPACAGVVETAVGNALEVAVRDMSVRAN